MKKLILILITLSLLSCGDDRFSKRAPAKGDICLELLNQRERARWNSDRSTVISTDSMLLRCGCDTIK